MRYFYIFCLIVICCTCREDAEIQPKDYPYVFTIGVTDIDSTGATCRAKILDYGREEILDFGFILFDNDQKTTYSLLNITEPDQFELRISSDLIDDHRYSVEAYVKTSHFSVFGNKISFTSLGSIMPAITSFSPDSGMDGTTVLITGNHFSKNEGGNLVRIGSAYAKVISANETEIIIETPRVNYYGKYKITVEVAGQTVNSGEDYTILGPRISSVSPMNAEPGDKVTINGDWMIDTASGAEVSFDDIGAEIVTAGLQQLVVIVPPYTREYNNIHIKAGLKTIDIPYPVKVSQEFIKLTSPDITGEMSDVSCATQSKGYLYNYGTLWEFNPGNFNSWTEVSHYPGQGTYNLYMYSLNNKVYMGGGNGAGATSHDFWEYDPDRKSWKRLTDVPLEIDPIGSFGLNDMGYILGENPENGSLWQYNSETDSWTKVSGIPPSVNSSILSFVINNIAYIKISDYHDNFFEYSESEKNWIKRADCPVQYLGSLFSSDGKGYCIYWQGDMYEYKPENDIWVTKQPYPGCEGGSFYYGFSINNKIYAGNASLDQEPYCQPSFYQVIP
jgi:hypothetical protein